MLVGLVNVLVVAGAGRQCMGESRNDELHHVSITVTLIAAAVNVEDSDEPSNAVDVIVSKPGSKRGG